jgi:Ca-activated chloride channel family protein
MIDWRQPWACWLLLVVPLLVVAWACRQHAALPHSLAHRLLVGGCRSPRTDWPQWHVGAAWTAALVCLTLALAGPRLADARSRIDQAGVAIVLVLDVSGSMGVRDVPDGSETITRLDAAKRAINAFVAGRAGDQIGLVCFADHPITVCPLTVSHAALLQLLQMQDIRRGLDNKTNLGDALAWALARLEPAEATRRVIVLVSDGIHEPNTWAGRRPLTPLQAAQLAANLEVPIYTIDPPGEPDPSEAEARAAGRAELQRIASLTGGQSFTTHDAAAMQAAFAQIDQLERRPLPTPYYRRYTDLRGWLALAAAGWLAIALLVERTLGRTLP